VVKPANDGIAAVKLAQTPFLNTFPNNEAESVFNERVGLKSAIDNA
jgi:hypothetical protein